MIRRSSRILLEVLAALAAGLVLLAGLAVWRLGGDEPVRLGFLTPYLEEALTASDGSFTVRIDRTLLTWAGWDRTFDLRARGVRALGADGRVIAAVPEIAVSLSVPALLRGQVAPTAIDVFGPRLYLTREPDGRFRFGRPGRDDAAAPENEASSFLPKLLAELLAPPDKDRATGYLRSASIIDGKLVYSDRRIGLTRRARDADIIVRRTPRGLAGELVLAVAQRGGAPARLRADVSYVRSSDSVSLSARFEEVAAAGFAELDPDLAPLARADMRARGRFVTTVGLDGSIGDTRLSLEAGPGTFALPALSDEPLRIRRLTMDGRLESGGDRLTVERAVLQLEGRQLEGRASGGPRLTLAGTATRGGARGVLAGGRLHVEGRVTAADVPAEMVQRYWPRGVARGARNWVTRNIDSGLVEHAEASFAFRLPGADDPGGAEVETFNGAFSAVGLTVRYIKEMPPLRDVAGIASFTDREFVADVHGGGVEGLSIVSGRVRIADFRNRGEPERIEIDGRVRGTLPDTLRLLDHPRLGYPSKLGIAPGDTAGDVAARLSFGFPAVKDLSFDQVEIGVTAEVAGAELREVMFGRDVSQGSFTVEVTSAEMTVAGSAVVGGVPAEIRWTENFSDAGPFRSRIALSGTVDAAQRAAFGLDLRPYLEGPVETELLLTRFAGGRSRLAASLGLAPAGIDLPFIAWSKPPGEPGAAELTLELEGERAVAISDLSVSAGSLSATGRGRFGGADGALRSIHLDSVTFGESRLEDVAIGFAGDRIDVAVGGGRLDAEPLLAETGGEEEPGEEEDTAFRLTADRFREVRLGPDRAVADVSASLRHDGEHWERIRIEGTLPGGHPMTVRYGPAESNTHRLDILAEDAGAALRTFGILDDVEGGRLRIVALAHDAEPRRPLRGEAEISQFRLVDAPVLARILTIATLTGLVDVLTGEGFLFTRFTGEFTKTGGEIEIPLARAYGPSIGLTATGEIDLDADIIDLEGTIVPAYAINNILGNIPVIGDILQGGKGEGIFAATYQASGPLADPRITVNPLAALAPGFLRGLFDIFDADAGERTRPTALPEPGSNK